MWYPVKACHMRDNLSVENDMLSRSVFELYTLYKFNKGIVPHFGGNGGGRGSGVELHESLPY